MSKIRIGIDPGTESYLCVWEEKSNQFYFHQFPTIGKEIDLDGINKLFRQYVAPTVSFDVHVVIENVHAIHGSSASSTWNFSKIASALETLLYAYNVPFTKVQPKVWQKEMWQGVTLQTKKSSTGKTQINDTKAMSEVAAKRLFPNIDLRRSSRCKTSDHNKVDALLIAEYCRRKF